MSDMTGRLEDLTAHARRLLEAGDLNAAQARLGDTLTFLDPKPGRATAAQAEAAAVYAVVLTRLDEPHSARAWAAYAHDASRRLFGDDDERTLAAANTLAAVLHRTAGHTQAAHLYRRLRDRLSRLDGPDSPRALAAAGDLATVLHARGDCGPARELLTATLRSYRREHGAGDRTAIKMLARLGAMSRDCGDFGPAHEHLAAARELCRQHLDPDDPLAAGVAALVRAPADRNHTCRTGPERLSSTVPPQAAGSAVPPPAAAPGPTPG
jgi:hypothetical protein